MENGMPNAFASNQFGRSSGRGQQMALVPRMNHQPAKRKAYYDRVPGAAQEKRDPDLLAVRLAGWCGANGIIDAAAFGRVGHDDGAASFLWIKEAGPGPPTATRLAMVWTRTRPVATRPAAHARSVCVSVPCSSS